MATSQVQQVQSRGIYHALPVYPSSLTGLTAIITGANGISGHYMLRVLASAPDRWKRIICLSRRPPLIPGGLPKNAEHVPCDFLKDPAEIAGVLRENGADGKGISEGGCYVFFFSYIQPPPKEGGGLWSDAEEMARVNSLLLSNFVEALKVAQVTPERFMLQTGAKNYGVHLGPTKVPQEESDPRVELEPNFYYPQEDILFAYSKESGCGWNVCMPGPILGAVPDAAMNAAYPLAVYATLCTHLRHPLAFPGDPTSWQAQQSTSSSMLNAYHEEWAVLTPRAANQKFNTCDSSAFAWEKCWPRIAEWYGIEWTGPVEEAECGIVGETRFNPRGYGGRGVVRKGFSMVEWAKREEVQRAWREVAEREGLVQRELVDVERVFGFLDGTLCRHSALNFSMDKSRKLGWHGFVDSNESFLEVFDDLAKLKMIPPVPKVKVSFN